MTEFSSVPDSHLQNPIRSNLRSLFVNRKLDPTEVPKFLLDLRKSCPVSHSLLDTDSEKMYGVLISQVYSDTFKVLPWIENNLSRIWKKLSDFILTHTPFRKDITPRRIKNLNTRLLRAFSVKQVWSDIRHTMQKARMAKSTKWKDITSYCPFQGYKTYYCQQFLILQDNEESNNWLFDYDQVMMISDTITSRTLTYLYNHIVHPGTRTKISYEIQSELYELFDSQFDVFGNSLYNSIKNIEPIVQGLILVSANPLQLSEVLLQSIITEATTGNDMITLKLISFLKSCKLTTEQLGELHGLFRHWGHPTVDEQGGCKKVRDITSKAKFPNYQQMKHSVGMFNKQFCISFIHKNGRWPRIDLRNLKSTTPLYSAIKNSNTSINFYSSNYPLKDWTHLRLEKEFEFDYHLDITEMCEDKAISPYLHDLPSIFAPECLGYRPKKPMSSRRVLIELLQKSDINMKSICEKIMKRDIPNDWYIVLLCGKERELKIQPRLFAMMVLEIRLYFNITEKNISDIIFPYFPQQTMTLSEVELTKRLYSMSKDDDNEYYIPMYMSIDFKSWNIHWNQLTTEPIFSKLDELFGTPHLYTFTHIFFQTCIMCLSSRYNTPQFLIDNKDIFKRSKIIDLDGLRRKVREANDPLMWTDHVGGLEGIRQKGWTLITIIILLIIETEEGIKCYIIGQGDNQFLKLMIPIKKCRNTSSTEQYIKQNQGSLRDRLIQYLETLERVAGEFCLKIKKEESWFSHLVINYGKDILVKGVYLSQGMKRVSRTFPDTNDIFPTILDKVSSMQTTGLATAQKSLDPITAYFICMLETILMIRKEVMSPLLSNVHHTKRVRDWLTSDTSIDYMLHGDTVCLNIPILNIVEYLYRGHPDPLSSYLTFLTINAEHCLKCEGILLYFINEKYEIGKGDPELLINNPLSINVDRPTQLSQIFKNIMYEKLKSTTKNRMIKEVFHMNSHLEDDRLYDYLLKYRPIYPRFLHEFLRQTVTACRTKIISKFCSARTFQGMLTRQDLARVNNSVIVAEVAHTNHWMLTDTLINRMSMKYKLLNPPCPTNLASKLRNHTWSEVTNDSVLLGVSIPHPIHQFSISMPSAGEHDNCYPSEEHIVLISDDPLTTDLLHKRGPFVPFHGHKTSEKTSGKILQIPEVSRPLKAAERLIQLYFWCMEQDRTNLEVVTKLIAQRTNIPLNILELSSKLITSGSQVHRLNDHFTQQGVHLNIRPNIASHIYLTSDSMGRFSKGNKNTNLHFQGALMLGITYAHWMSIYNESIDSDGNTVIHIPSCKRPIIHLHYTCLNCEEYLNDTKVYNDTVLRVKTYKTQNPLIYADITLTNLSVVPDSLLLKIVKRAPTAPAVASLLLSRIIVNKFKSTWGPSQTNQPYTSPISLRTILEIGILPVMKHLAILLHLYYDLQTIEVYHLVNAHGQDIWQDFGPSCLVKELMEELLETGDHLYQAQLYESRTGYTRLLNHALLIQYKKVNQLIKNLGPNLIFFPTKGVGISRIFRMWANLIWCYSDGNADIQGICQNSNFETVIGMNIPSQDSLNTIDNYIMHKPELQYYCWDILRLKLSGSPPEIAMQGQFGHIKHHTIKSIFNPTSFKCIELSGSTLVFLYELPSLSDKYYKLDTDFPHPPLQISKHTYNNHIFHQVANISVAYLKIMQILMVFGHSSTENAVCLADGEGSISKLLIRMCNKIVFFNTKLDLKKMLAQRIIHYVPGECVDVQDKLRLTKLSALYGGDLLDDNYLEKFLRSLPQHASIVTFDAESSQPFTPKQVMKFVEAVMKICYKCNGEMLIYKIHCYIPGLLAAVIGALNVLYAEIHLTVPIFCSNQNYEVYLVCRGIKSSISPTLFGLVGTPLRDATIGFLSALREKRISKQLFFTQGEVWEGLLKNGLALGFNRAITYHKLRFLNFYESIYEGEDIEGWLHESKKQLQNTIESITSGLIKTTKAIHLKVSEQLSLRKSKCINTLYEGNLTSIGCLDLLQEILKESNHIDAEKKLTSYNDMIYTITCNQTILYSFEFSVTSLRPDTLKSLWVIWGYHMGIFKN